MIQGLRLNQGVKRPDETLEVKTLEGLISMIYSLHFLRLYIS